MTLPVYINDLSAFLPNAPVDNESIEQVLGMVGGKPSRSRKTVLRSNGIQTRHYAIDPKTGKFTHNNAQLTAEAIRSLVKKSRIGAGDIGCISCGTSSADQLQPSHGYMVHGELGYPPCEVSTSAGVCTSGMLAMKYGYMNVALGLTSRAVVTGSEFVSSFMRSVNFEPEIQAQIENLKKRPEIAFEKDFLRWMLSDGAGAALLSATPNEGRHSLRIDWIDHVSLAGDMPVCMYSGAIKREDGSLQSWRELEDPHDAVKGSYFAVKQDARLLGEHIIPAIVDRVLLPVAAKRALKAGDVTWFLPHYSSDYFKQRLHDGLAASGFGIPFERWFSNLTSKGNVGSAAIYLIIEEMLYSGKLKKGDRLLCLVPESARFSVCYMHLTVV